MGGHVSLLCIRWDFQCLDFGLSPSKHCRKVKAIFKAAAQLHTSVTQTDDSWPLIWSVELKYGIWAACLVDVPPIFSVKSFYHFSMFGGFPSENMPFFHPFCTHLFSLWSFQRWRRSGTGAQNEAPVSPLIVSTAHPHFSQLLLLCTKADSDPFGSDTMNLKTSYSVSSGPLLPRYPQYIVLLHSPRLSAQGVVITI